ncbi:MAG: helix-turn-helix domain-containing protein [Candidatus Binatia bacterium]
MEEQKRVEVIGRVFRGEMTMAEAAMALGVSERHSYRIKARIKKEGVKGVIHGNRGRSCDRKLHRSKSQMGRCGSSWSEGRSQGHLCPEGSM